jgi:hypothetical protein
MVTELYPKQPTSPENLLRILYQPYDKLDLHMLPSFNNGLRGVIEGDSKVSLSNFRDYILRPTASSDEHKLNMKGVSDIIVQLLTLIQSHALNRPLDPEQRISVSNSFVMRSNPWHCLYDPVSRGREIFLESAVKPTFGIGEESTYGGLAWFLTECPVLPVLPDTESSLMALRLSQHVYYRNGFTDLAIHVEESPIIYSHYIGCYYNKVTSQQ